MRDIWGGLGVNTSSDDCRISFVDRKKVLNFLSLSGLNCGSFVNWKAVVKNEMGTVISDHMDTVRVAQKGCQGIREHGEQVEHDFLNMP